MVFNPARPEIRTVTSESLQAKIRELLPSQDGFGADLAAQNVIVPIIDLTEQVVATTTPEMLQTALAFGSQTPFRVVNTTTTLENTPGFYRVFGVAHQLNNTTVNFELMFNLTDGATVKEIWNMETEASVANSTALQFDFIVFLAAGESIQAKSIGAGSIFVGSTRQIADSNGTLVQPSGFTPQ